MNNAELTSEQRGALGRFVAHHGDDWKRWLMSAWMTGEYRAAAVFGDDAAYLQQVRNTFGPDWLSNQSQHEIFESENEK